MRGWKEGRWGASPEVYTFPGVSCPRWGSGLQPRKARLHKHSTNLTGNKKIPIAGIHFVELIGRWARCSRGPWPRALPVVRGDTAHGGVCQLWRTVRSEPVRVASFRMDAALEVDRGRIKAARMLFPVLVDVGSRTHSLRSEHEK